MVIRRNDDPERELTIVPSIQVEHIIRFYYEGPGGAHQAPNTTSAKIIGCFWWPNLKHTVGTVYIDAEVTSTAGVTLPLPLETLFKVPGLRT